MEIKVLREERERALALSQKKTTSCLLGSQIAHLGKSDCHFRFGVS